MHCATTRGVACVPILLLVAGCQFGGVNSLDMPGTAGHGRNSYTITVELPDVSALPQNSPVKVDDITVGSVSGLRAVQRSDGTFFASVQLSLAGNVELPDNTVVKVAQTTLLGSQHIELGAPVGEDPVGRLEPNATIPVGRAGRYPSTEEVLSSLGVVVNKGNLGAIEDITNELYQAVAGNVGEFRGLVPRLAELTAAIDRQTSDIVDAATSLNRLAAQLSKGGQTLDRALESLPAALDVVSANSQNVVDAFTSLRRLGDVAADMLARTKAEFAADVKYLYPVAKALADNADDLVGALNMLPTYPFPASGIRQSVRGDFLNSFATFDLTLRRLGENFFTTSALDPNMKHLSEILNPPDFLIGSLANLSGQAADPFDVPEKLPSPEGNPPR